MNNKISCHIVRDLLPSYIDNVISDETRREIKDHLDECSDCKKIFDEMNTEDITVNNFENEASLIRKVKSKMDTKTRNIVIISAVVCIALIIFVWIGTTQAIFSIKSEDVGLDVSTEKISNGEVLTSEELDDSITVVTSKDSDEVVDASKVVINDNDGNSFTFAVDNEIKESNEYVSVVTWKPKRDIKLLSVICTDRRDDEDNIIIDITDFKTDLYSYLFARNTKNKYPSTTAMYFGKVVEINYNGNTLWKVE